MTTNKTNRSASFDAYFIEKLRDPEFVREYINTLLEDLTDEGEFTSEEEVQATFLRALRDIIEAQGGINQFAKKIPELHRTTLYGIFSDGDKRKKGPEFLTVLRIMKACGVSLKAA